MTSQLKQDAISAFKSGKNAKCIALFNALFETDEADYFDYLYIARAYMKAGLPDPALLNYDRAIDYSPSHGTAFTRKSCYLLEQKTGEPQLRAPSANKKQISMATLGNKCRFGNQIFQYAYLISYADKFNLDVGTPVWVGSYVFGLNDPLPNTRPGTIKEFRLEKSMLEILHGDENVLQNRNITGFFQHHTGSWNEYRTLFKQIFKPSKYFSDLITNPLETLRSQGQELVVFHIRRGDYTLLEEFPTAPTEWYLDWLDSNWRLLSNPVLYIATDDPDTVLDFADYDARSYADLGIDMKGVEFTIDWLILREGDVLGISDSSFSMSAAMANTSSKKFLRPDFDAEVLSEFDPWNSPILSSGST